MDCVTPDTGVPTFNTPPAMLLKGVPGLKSLIQAYAETTAVPLVLDGCM